MEPTEEATKVRRQIESLRLEIEEKKARLAELTTVHANRSWHEREDLTSSLRLLSALRIIRVVALLPVVAFACVVLRLC